MADQVLDIDPDNFKAHLRKAESLVVIEELAKAEKEIEICQQLASSREEKLEVQDLFKRYKVKEQKEKQFAKEAMSKSMYQDKPLPPAAPIDPNID